MDNMYGATCELAYLTGIVGLGHNHKVPGAAKTMKNKGHELQPSFSRFCDGKPGF